MSASREGTYGPWDGDAYQRRFDELAATGKDVHGEVGFVMMLEPVTVLDAGCGTGRVARSSRAAVSRSSASTPLSR